MRIGSTHRSNAVLACGAALALALAFAPAKAQAETDNDPPIITHTAKNELPRGKVKVDFRIADKSALFGVLFHWRHVGDPSFRQIDFPTSQEKYTAEFEAQQDFEFWIEAYDEHGNGPALDGTADQPNRIKVIDSLVEKPLDAPAEDKKVVQADPCANGEAFAIDGLTPCTPVEQKPAGAMRIGRVGRVLAARNMNQGMFEIVGAGSLMQGGDFLYAGTSLFGTTGALKASWAPLPFLSVGVGTAFRGATLSSSQNGVAPRTGGSMNDVSLNVRYASGPLSIARVGFEAFVDLPSKVNAEPYDPTGRDALVASPGFNALLSLDVHPMFRLHANAGYYWNNSENLFADQSWSAFKTFAWGISRYDAINFALAAEIPVGNIVPFLEYSLSAPVDRRAFSGCKPGVDCGPAPGAFPALNGQVPQRFGLGVRYEISPTIGVDAGVELSLTGAGRGFTSSSRTVLPALDGVAPPPPFAALLNFTYQFGADYSSDDSAAPAPAPSASDALDAAVFDQ